MSAGADDPARCGATRRGRSLRMVANCIVEQRRSMHPQGHALADPVPGLRVCALLPLLRWSPEPVGRVPEAPPRGMSLGIGLPQQTSSRFASQRPAAIVGQPRDVPRRAAPRLLDQTQPPTGSADGQARRVGSTVLAFLAARAAGVPACNEYVDLLRRTSSSAEGGKVGQTYPRPRRDSINRCSCPLT